MTLIQTLGMGLLLAATAASVQAELPDKKVLTLSVAKRIAAAAEAEAAKRAATVVIAVVDDGGHLLVLHRLDDTQVASVDVGIGKARTAAIFRRPSKVFEDQIREGRVAALAIACPGRAVCGYFPPPVSTSAPSFRPSILTILPGATQTAGRSTCVRAAASTTCG